jgi:dolichol-phosphate mannosyltransferase
VLSVVLPTYNEAANISTMVTHIAGVLSGIPHEIIVVDDNSPDATWQVAESLKIQFPQVRVIRRLTEKGLSSAAVAGFAAAEGTILCLMDSDGQHDPALLPVAWQTIQNGADIVVGSRYMPGGSVGEWIRDRRILSRMGTWLAQCVSRRDVTDPLSGFFALRREAFLTCQNKLRPSGFKILLEILAHLPASARVTEIPLVFKMRTAGESKLSWRIEWQFICQVVRLAFI